MKNVRPCPYCGGEVEVVRMADRPKTKEKTYRIECRHCHALVARGYGFPIETISEAEERIRDYERVIAEQLAPIYMQHITQTRDAKRRDRIGYERA